jgi:hypothetical protein
VDYIVKHGEKEVRKGGKGTPGLSDEELTVFDENFVNVDLGTLYNLTLVHPSSKPCFNVKIFERSSRQLLPILMSCH